MTSHDRFNWALKILQIQPRDEVLEIGCGTGLAAGMVAERLDSGRITAIDRSTSMISKAKTKVRSDKIQFIAGQLGELELPHKHFSKAFAFNVSGFWMPDAVTELRSLLLHLKASGAFYLFHQPPTSTKTKAIAEKSIAFLEAAGLGVEEVLFAKIEPALASCIVSKPQRSKAKTE